MGNCHFKTEFESENVTGTFPIINPFSAYQKQLHLPLLHWQGRLRQSLESRAQEVQAAVRHEGNVKGPNYNEAKH